jgi:co-chaperonin GroES (HSP10)
MAIKGKLKPLGSKVIVHNMNFGEQVSRGGIFIPSDDGKSQGVHPRWAQVYAKGVDNAEPFNVGDWILIEHGRWTRGSELIEEDGNKITIRMVDNDCIMMWDTEKPNDAILGNY